MPESISKQLLALRASVQGFVENKLRPLEQDIEDDGTVPKDVRRKVRQMSRDAGFFNMTQPVEHGGNNTRPLALVVARETCAAYNSPLARYVFGPRTNVFHAAEGGLKSAIVEPLLKGEITGAWAFTESSGGGAPERPTYAIREGSDLLISGRKSYVSGGADADFYSVVVNVEEDAKNVGGMAIVVVERNRSGLSIERVFRSIDGSDHAEVRLDNVRVPITNVVGKIGEGMPRALINISEERLEQAATATGMCLWAVEYVTKHITAPHRSGTRLADREGVRLRYSDMRIETYAARSTLYRTARLVEAGENPVNEVMASRVFCAEVAGRVVDQAVQLVGGQALVVGHPLESLYRRVRSMRLSGGASDILRMNIARGIIEFDAGRL